MKNGNDERSFKEKLDANHNWPSVYMFKFIIPKQQEAEIYKLFDPKDIRKKASRGGNYLSITAKIKMGSSEDVMEIYREAYKIKDIISL